MLALCSRALSWHTKGPRQPQCRARAATCLAEGRGAWQQLSRVPQCPSHAGSARSSSAAALTLAQGTSCCRPAATGLALSARASCTLRACLREPWISLKLPRVSRGWEECLLCEGTAALCEGLSWHGSCVTAGGGDTSCWPVVAAEPPERSFAQAELGSTTASLASLGQAGAGGAPGSCLSSALQLRVGGGGGGEHSPCLWAVRGVGFALEG